jgi:hypothetical protein
MGHEWKIGDWCELHSKRYLVFKRSDFDVWAIGPDHGVILFLVNDEEVKHIPDCDSWDWQPPEPIEPPEGYRLLIEGEQRIEPSDAGEGYRFIDIKTDAPQGGDEFWSVDQQMWILRGCNIAFDGIRNNGRTLYRRKIELQYRPFANAAEFAPHRDKWLRSDTQSHGEVIGRVMNYSEKGIVDDVGNFRTFETLFRVCTFDDGTKCGVKLDDDAKPIGGSRLLPNCDSESITGHAGP